MRRGFSSLLRYTLVYMPLSSKVHPGVYASLCVVYRLCLPGCIYRVMPPRRCTTVGICLPEGVQRWVYASQGGYPKVYMPPWVGIPKVYMPPYIHPLHCWAARREASAPFPVSLLG